MREKKSTMSRKFTRLFLVLIAVVSLGFWGLSQRYVTPILVYHSVNYSNNPKVLVPIYEGVVTGNIVTPENFFRQMDYLQKHQYNVISLNELVTATVAKSSLPAKSVVITFDDGYADNYVHAFPVLKKYGFPATIFVLVATVGQDGWLTWAQIKEMDTQGIDIGSHTVNHAYLPEISEEKQHYEIEESKKILEEKLGHAANYIAYPAGGFAGQIKTIVKDAGYKGACTTNRGFEKFNRDVYELKRIRVSNKDDSFFLWAKLSGFYNLFRSAKSPY